MMMGETLGDGDDDSMFRARQPKHNREAKLKNGGQSLAERSLTRWPESLADISCT